MTCRWSEVVDHMNSLLEVNLRLKSQRPLHKPELRRLVHVAAVQAADRHDAQQASTTAPPPPPTPIEQIDGAEQAIGTSVTAGEGERPSSVTVGEGAVIGTVIDPVMSLPSLAARTEKLLQRITRELPSDPEVGH